MNNDELMHYGILGMKWGHRKPRPESGRRVRHREIRREYRRLNKQSDSEFYKTQHGKELRAMMRREDVRAKKHPGYEYGDAMSQRELDRDEYLRKKQESYSKDYANTQLRNKYGEARMNKYERTKKRRRMAMDTLGSAAALGGLMYLKRRRR